MLFFICLFRRSSLSNSPLVKILIPLISLFLLNACSFKEPVLPNWLVKINVPLQGETFKLGDEIANDSTITIQGSDSLLHIQIDGELDSEEVSAADFETEQIDTLNSFELGTIELDSLSILKTGRISLGTIFPDLNNYIIPGQTIPMQLPDTTLVPPLKSIETTDFKGMKIVSGDLVLHFSNHLPFSLGPNSGHPNGIEVIVFDSTMQQIEALTFNQIIFPGQSVSQTIPISATGGWIYAPIYVQYIVPIAQASTFDLNETVLDTAGVEIDVELRDLAVEAAYAKIEKQNISESRAIKWEDPNKVREATLESGTLNLTFSNNIPLSATVNFTLPNFITPANFPYHNSLMIPANGQGSVTVSVDGFSILNHREAGSFIDSVEVKYDVQTKASSGMVQINATDNVDVHVNLSPIRFSSLSGFLAPDTFEIDTYEDDNVMDYEDVTPNFNLPDVEMNLTLSNEVSIENLAVDFEIIGYHKNSSGQYSDSARISINDYPIIAGSPGAPVASVISLTGSQVSNFLNILPTKIRSKGRVRVSGNVNISETAQLSGNYSFNVPLRLSIQGDAAFEGKVDTLLEKDIDKDIRDAADDELQSADLGLRVLNATPVGGSIILYVARDSSLSDIYQITENKPGFYFKKEIAFTPGTTDNATGFVISPAQNELNISLSQSEIRLFQSPPLRVGYQVKLSETNGVIALRGSDYLKISGIASFEVKISE